MNHKTFVFFDCECANTFEGIGKICSLGYVVTDDEFNVIESEDVVMNPECEFDWYLLSGKGDVKLAYSKDYFRAKPNFSAYYKGIKKLFTTGNRFVAGFAVANDVSFVNAACVRYKLPYINFRTLDAERIFEQKYGEKRKLLGWADFFNVNVSKFQSHKSVDDAMMTMLCLKRFCEKESLSGEELFKTHKGFFVSSEQMLVQAEEKAYRKEVMEKLARLYGKTNPRPRHKNLVGKVIELDSRLFKDVDAAFELVKEIYARGGTVVETVAANGFVLVPDGEEMHPNRAKNARLKGIQSMSVSEVYGE